MSETENMKRSIHAGLEIKGVMRSRPESKPLGAESDFQPAATNKTRNSASNLNDPGSGFSQSPDKNPAQEKSNSRFCPCESLSRGPS